MSMTVMVPDEANPSASTYYKYQNHKSSQYHSRLNQRREENALAYQANFQYSDRFHPPPAALLAARARALSYFHPFSQYYRQRSAMYAGHYQDLDDPDGDYTGSSTEEGEISSKRSHRKRKRRKSGRHYSSSSRRSTSRRSTSRSRRDRKEKSRKPVKSKAVSSKRKTSRKNSSSTEVERSSKTQETNAHVGEAVSQELEQHRHLDLSKPLKPVNAYLRDRPRMVQEMMLISTLALDSARSPPDLQDSISAGELRAMMPPILREMSRAELVRALTETLEVMSKKRIRRVLAGDAVEQISSSEAEEPSSAPDDDEEEDETDLGERDGKSPELETKVKSEADESLVNGSVNDAAEISADDSNVGRSGAFSPQDSADSLEAKREDALQQVEQRIESMKAGQADADEAEYADLQAEIVELEMKARLIRVMLKKT